MKFVSVKGPNLIVKGFDNQEYKVSPISLTEWDEYALWYSFKEYEDAKKLKVDKEKLNSIYDKCLDNAKSVDHPDVQESLSTPAGLAHIVYLGARINHLDIKKENISKVITMKNYKEILDKFFLILGMETESEEESEKK